MKIRKLYCLLAFVLLCCLTGCGKKVITPLDYVGVEYSQNADGTVTAAPVVDWIALDEDIYGKDRTSVEKLSDIDTLQYYFEFSLDKYIGLDDGDEITINVLMSDTFAKKNKVKMKSSSKKLTVDCFEYIDPFSSENFHLMENGEDSNSFENQAGIVIDGKLPELKLKAKNCEDENSIISHITYKIEFDNKDKTYKAGNDIRVSADFTSTNSMNGRIYKLTETKKRYKVIEEAPYLKEIPWI